MLQQAQHSPFSYKWSAICYVSPWNLIYYFLNAFDILNI